MTKARSRVFAGTSLGARGAMHGPLAAESAVSRAIRGSLVGAVATVAMSVVMLASQRAGLMLKQPPERVVERGADAADLPADESAVDVAASVAHVAFGAAGGLAFGLLRPRLPSVPPEPIGLAWGLVIWAVSYFGWVPALRIVPPPTDDRPGRAWTMALAHVVYGLALGGLWRVTSRTRSER